jgi:hypothetical protein
MFTRTIVRALSAAACGVALLASAPALATTFTVSGTLSGTYPVSARAEFITSGSTLTLTLQNTSTTPTAYGAQVLTSFYFDLLVNGTGRPTLTYVSGTGNVFKITGTSAAVPYLYVPPTTSGSAFTVLPSPQPSNIKSSSPNDNSWYFRSDLNETLKPYTRFGIGTVGNSGSNGFNPNNFPATYVDGIDFGIFTGDGSNPKGQLASQRPYLVKDSAVFTFTAQQDLSSLTFNDPFVFGFGTEPDQSITIVPEPSGIALVGVLVPVGIGWIARRRSERVRVASRSVACTALVVGLVVGLVLAGRGATAAPIQTVTWDFNVQSQATQWTALNTYGTTPVPQDPKWTWVAGSGSTPGTWHVGSVGVSSPGVKFGNYLTSQLIQLSPDLPADKFTFSVAHRFRMPTNGFTVNGVQLPVVAGQFEYSLDGAAFLPVFKTDWVASGTISPVLTPYVQSSTWAVPQFVPGVAPVVSLPPLIDGGASFTGNSQGRDSGWFVASQAFEVDIPGLTTTIQFRFTKMDLASNCGIDPGWDLRFARADLILAPEPGGVMMAAAGGALAAAAMLRRRYQRPSRPSVRP